MMSVLGWRKTYDRAAVLDHADRARGRGSVRKAIRGYSTILQHDPNDHQVHARVAPSPAPNGDGRGPPPISTSAA